MAPHVRITSEIINRFAERTSVIGPSYIATSKHIISKLIWIIFFLTSVAMTIYMVAGNFNRFFNWPTKTMVSIGYKHLDFPMVIICNSNPLRKSQLFLADADVNAFLGALDPAAFSRNITDEESTDENFGSTSPIPNVTASSSRKKRYIDSYQQQQQSNTTYVPEKSFDYEDDVFGAEGDPRAEVEREFEYMMSELSKVEKQLMGHQKDDMIVSCSFEGRRCSKRNFTRHASNTYGNCYKFNDGMSSSRYTSRRSGSKYGLQLILNLEMDEYVAGLTLGYGIRALVTHPNTFPSITTEGTLVAAGSETDMGIRLTNISRKEEPYGECTWSNAFLEASGHIYTRIACQDSCELQLILQTCNCFISTDREKYPTEYIQFSRKCNTTKDHKCLNKIKREQLHGTLQCNCPPACNESVYEPSISSREWPERSYLHALVDVVCRKSDNKKKCNKLLRMKEADQRRNFLKLNVFYKDLNYELISEEADYPDTSFFSDLGGAIGLWVGLSVMSILEVGQLLFELLYWAFRRRAGGSAISDSCESVRKKAKVDACHTERYSMQQSGSEKDVHGVGINVYDPNTPSRYANK